MFMIIFMTSFVKNCKKLTSSLVSFVASDPFFFEMGTQTWPLHQSMHTAIFVASDLQVNARCLAKLQPMLVSWLRTTTWLAQAVAQQLYVLNTNHLEGRPLCRDTVGYS
jgi:hypothetical protein